jgi:hypothetical protein
VVFVSAVGADVDEARARVDVSVAARREEAMSTAAASAGGSIVGEGEENVVRADVRSRK